ncbi:MULTISPECIES: hypothetical protein [Pseudomonas]|jgi:hypothetical protein|uniref:Uncharacterized protein n=1 Tax=Pseudomonas brassicacearum (strain NFM421) TaxID=994484 RepID=F2KCS7_PSEBN|nr:MULTISPECIES: hypothetical protein [Pseudomonas]EIK70938.1 hypothetical protein PflQ8_1057 [Pseudomonas fluorescens Q8r1-96]KIR15058.1 hypothetical protein PFLU4_40080 [Pseudomonas fluorescens]AEA67209.1 Conserved hypothetical protein [Pseudomonas brassicacearum subsp. brassicacearum NFM421]ALQ01769.1 hypothetical protein AK973_1320 [Pseudomonas brassicacearum]AOS39255.1 hypothetical protein A0U95_10895 [Pseudomonas brassicacearum]
MRIDGFSSQSYPIKRKPRAGKIAEQESFDDDIDGELEFPSEEQLAARAAKASAQRLSNLPARQQDMLYHRAMSRSVATALASYLSTAGFVDWDMEVLGLDLYI